MFSWKLLKPLWVGKSSENERERRLPKGAMRWAGSAFCQKSDRGPTVTWTRRRRVSGSSWKRTALRDRPASYKNKTKEALCRRLHRLKWVVKLIVFFVPAAAGPQNVSPVLNDLARLRATAKFQITPACDFRESILIPFFFGLLACRRWFCLFIFTSVWDFQPDDAQVRSGSPLIVTRQNQQAAPVCSKVCWTCSGGLFCRCSIVKRSVCLYLVEEDFSGCFFSCW